MSLFNIRVIYFPFHLWCFAEIVTELRIWKGWISYEFQCDQPGRVRKGIFIQIMARGAAEYFLF